MPSSKITTTDIKNYCTNLPSGTDYDSLITTLINDAYARLDQYVGLDTANDKFMEYLKIKKPDDDKSYVFVSGNSKDIVLTKIEIDGTSISLTTDLTKKSWNKWEIINDDYTGETEFYAEYTSVNLTARVKKIIFDIVVFELNKSPGMNNSISKKLKQVDGFTSEQYISDDQFYKGVVAALSALFTRDF